MPKVACQRERGTVIDNLLRNIADFKELSDDDLSKLLRVSVEISGTPGQVLYKEGDPSDAFFVVRAGSVRRATGCKADGTGGKELALLKAGDPLGVDDVLEDKARSAWAVVAEPSTLLQIKRADWDNLMALNPRIATKIMIAIAHRGRAQSAVPEEQEKAPDKAPREEGRVIVINSMTGGAGVTTLVTNLGVELAREGQKKVVLVDGSIQFGDLPIFVDEVPNLTLFQLSEEPEINLDLLQKGYLNKTKFGVDLVAGPKRPEQADRVKEDLLRAMVGTLRKAYDYVVVDSMSPMQEPTLTLLEVADVVLYVMRADIPSLKNTGLWLDLIRALEFDPEKIKIVINMYPPKPAVDLKAIEAKLKLTVLGALPHRPEIVMDCINRGVPFCIDKPADIVSVKVSELAKRILNPDKPLVVEEPSKGFVGLIKKLLGMGG